MANLNFDEFKEEVLYDLNVAEAKIDIPSNDVSEYEKAVDDWNALTEILCNIECFEEEVRINKIINEAEDIY